MVSEDMEREMVNKNDVEAIAKEVFSALGLDWVPFHVVFDGTINRWWIQTRMPSHKKVLIDLYAHSGSRDAVKESLKDYARRKIQELESK